MKFTTKNAYYLRLSAHAVLPLYLYLDEQHVEWMSERVLQHVLSDLRPLIPIKLVTEDNAILGSSGSSNTKKGTVDVHRGDTYQFGYFLRNTEPHSVLIKTRRFTAAPKVKPVNVPPPSSDQASSGIAKTGRKRSRHTTGRTAASKGKAKAQQALPDDDEEEAEFSDNIDALMDDDGGVRGDRNPLRRSTRRRTAAVSSYAEDEGKGDIEIRNTPDIQDSEEQPNAEKADSMLMQNVGSSEEDVTMSDTPTLPLAPPDDTLMVDEEEEKPKPVMQLQYQGFSIHGRCLCVIVEPYPLVRQHRPMSLAPTGIIAPRAPNITPLESSTSANQPSKTPLFLPDDEEEEEDYVRRSVTPGPVQQHQRPPVPLFHETQDENDEDNGGMFAFSQVLHSMGEHYTGAVDDDDEMDGMVLFGDADEVRGL